MIETHAYSNNTTLASKLVLPVAGIDPQTDCSLVLFEREGKRGHRFHSTLAPEDRFSPGLFGGFFTRPWLVAYAVSNARNRRHHFDHSVTTWDHAGSLTLHVDFCFQIADARRVVEAVGDDPLLRLQSEISSVLGLAASRIDWVSVEEQGVKITNLLLSESALDSRDGKTTNFDRLQSFAAELGFELHSLELGVTFAEEFGRAIRIQREQIRQRLIDEANRQTLMGRSALEFREHVRALFGQVLTRISEGVSSAPQLTTAIHELRSLQGQILELSASSAPTPEPARSANGSAPIVSLVSMPEKPQLAQLLDESFRILWRLPATQAQREMLFANILSLIGETLLGDAADREKIDDLRRALGRAEEHFGPLDSDEKELLALLVSPARLRQRILGWEDVQ